MIAHSHSHLLKNASILLLALFLYFCLSISDAMAYSLQADPAAESEGMSWISIFILAKFGLLLLGALGMMAHLFGIIRFPWVKAENTVA